MAKVLKDETARRLMAMLNARDFGLGRLTRPQAGQRFVYCLCDDDTAIGGDAVLDECYPATVLLPASDQATPPELSGAVLLTVLGSGGASVVPEVGMPYFGVLAGDVESDGSGSLLGRPRVFGLPFPSGGTPEVYGQAFGGAVSLAANSTWYDLSCDVTLPSAGIYEIVAACSASAQISAGPPGMVCGRVYNENTSNVVATIYNGSNNYGSEAVILILPVTGVSLTDTATWVFRMEAEEATTLRLEAARAATGATYFTANAGGTALGSGGVGPSLQYRKIGTIP